MNNCDIKQLNQIVFSSLATENLLSIILDPYGSINDIDNLCIDIANFIRSKGSEKIAAQDLLQFENINYKQAEQIIAALEVGKRYYIMIHRNQEKSNWDFEKLKQSERQYGVHFFHHYTAKFIPQIAERIIRQYTTNDDIVFDPFMGSGTALIEAKMIGCHSYGLDTNPLAVKISQAKSIVINKEKLHEIDSYINWLLKKKKEKDKDINSYPNIELFEHSNLWFRKDVAYKINDSLQEISKYSPEVKNFLEIGISTLLKGMSNARMDSVIPLLPDSPIYTDRKHYYRDVNNDTRIIPVYNRIYSQISRMRSAILEFNKETDESLICKPIMGDARELSNFVKKCDLVVTSPPYWSAQNYEKIHMLSMKLFGLTTIKGKEIGRDKEAYLNDMQVVIQQISNILTGYFALVIGHDNKLQMHEKLLQIACDTGFNHIETFVRRVSNQVSIAKQIRKEYIYILKI